MSFKYVRTVFVAGLVGAFGLVPTAMAAPGDGQLGGTPSATPASTACPAGKGVTGVTGRIVGPNPAAGEAAVGSATALCEDGAVASGTMGTAGDPSGSTVCAAGQVAVGIQGHEVGLFGAGGGVDQLAVRCRAADLTGPIVVAADYGGIGGAADGPYDCPEGQRLAGLDGSVVSTVDLGDVVRHLEIACALAPTSTTLSVNKTSRRLKASGEVGPSPVAGEEIAVTLYRKREGRFRQIAAKRPALNTEAQYRVGFRRPPPGRCRIKARFAGTETAAPSSATKRFRC